MWSLVLTSSQRHPKQPLSLVKMKYLEKATHQDHLKQYLNSLEGLPLITRFEGLV